MKGILNNRVRGDDFRPANVEPIDLDFLRNQIEVSTEADLLGDDIGTATQIIWLVQATDEFAKSLNANYGEKGAKQLYVEENELLDLWPPELPELSSLASESTVIPSGAEKFEARITVKGGSPLQVIPRAIVYLLGQLWFAKGVTNDNGEVTLTLCGATSETVRALYVKPRDTYWNLWVDNPRLNQSVNNQVVLTSLNDALPPNQEVYGWGQKAMKLDQRTQYKGQGIKIGIIDSGLNTAHEELKEEQGHDFTNSGGWQKDVVGHGTHVGGVVAALHGNEALGMKGFAPESEVYAFKIFPGGRFADLIQGLKLCIDNNVDVVNLSLGSKNPSANVEQMIKNAKQQGVACIAAAGNSAGAVQYPAALNEVLAVAAIGQKGTYPQESYHKRQETDKISNDENNYFAARFTCFGNQVDVCAPGVAVISSVPVPAIGQRPYAAWDGTSMACPHVVGLAALILETNQELKNMQRGAAKVDKLFEIIKNSVIDLGLPAEYQGTGLPSAVKAIPGSGGNGDPWRELERILKEALEIIKNQRNQS